MEGGFFKDWCRNESRRKIINNNRQTDVAYPGLDVGYESGGRE